VSGRATARRGPARLGERGWSLPELMVTVGILAVVTNIAIPVMSGALARAQASAICEDFATVRQAVVDYYQTNSAYPAERAVGVVPPEIRTAIANKVNFNNTKLRVQYDWEYWINAQGNPTQRATGVTVGFSVVTTDQKLIAAIQRVYRGGCFVRVNSTKYTFVIEPVPGAAKPC